MSVNFGEVAPPINLAEFNDQVEQLEMLTDTFSDEIEESVESIVGVMAVAVGISPLLQWITTQLGPTIESLEKTIPACIAKVKKADADKFGPYKAGNIKVMSGYLPDQKDFSGAVKAITKACAYIKSIVDVSKFDKDKFEAAFSGSVYVKAGKLSNDTKLGYMHLNLFQKDIRTRGWDSKDKFLSALNEMKNLLPIVKGLKDSVKRLKDSSTKDADKKAIKMYSLYTKQTLKYVSFIGRGIVAASKRMCSGALGKIFADSK